MTTIAAFPDTLTIEVLQEDIDAGDHSCDSCPVALGFLRAIEPLKPEGQLKISTVPGNTWIWLDEQRVTYDHPNEAAIWISDFDGSEPIAPFTFVATRGAS